MGSIGSNATQQRIKELRQKLEETKGLLSKALIQREIDMLEAGWKGTLDEWIAKQREEREQAQERANQEAREREEAKRRAKQEAEAAKQRQIEEEMRTLPEHKVEQYRITQKYNPMNDDYHTGIRKPSDIQTWAEAVKSADTDGAFVWGDFSKADAERALKTGKITIYSSYPIEQGVFVSTSKIQAEQYAGGTGKKVYKKTVPLTEVAWISGDEGQYANTKKR